MRIIPDRQHLLSHPESVHLLTLILAAVDSTQNVSGSYAPFGRTLEANGTTLSIPLNPNTPLKYVEYYRQELRRLGRPGVCCVWEEEQDADGREQNVLRVEFFYNEWLSFCAYIPEINTEAWWTAEPVAS